MKENKKYNIMQTIIITLIIILIGLGIGYGAYKIQENKYEINDNGDKQVDKDNKEEKTEDEDNETDQNNNKINNEFSIEVVQVDEYYDGIKINNQTVFRGLGVAYEVIDDLVIAYETDGTSDIQNMAVFNKKGDMIFNPEGLENGLLLVDIKIDKNNKKLLLQSNIDEESGAKSKNIYNTTGKDSLYDLTCSELEYYKDKLVAIETFELVINGDSFKLNSIDKKYLKDYVKYDFNHYEDLVNNCQN